jgi:hypothetical protein
MDSFITAFEVGLKLYISLTTLDSVLDEFDCRSFTRGSLLEMPSKAVEVMISTHPAEPAVEQGRVYLFQESVTGQRTEI